MIKEKKSFDLAYVFLGALVVAATTSVLEVMLRYVFEILRVLPVRTYTLPFMVDEGFVYNVFILSLYILLKRGYTLFLLIVLYSFLDKKYSYDYVVKYLILFIFQFVNYQIILNIFFNEKIPIKEAVLISLLASFIIPFLLHYTKGLKVLDDSRSMED